MASVNITQEEKTEILNKIISNITKTAAYKLPKMPEVEKMIGRAFANWFQQEIEPKIKDDFHRQLLPKTHRQITIELTSLPKEIRNVVVQKTAQLSCVGSRNWKATWGGMPYYLKNFELENHTNFDINPNHIPDSVKLDDEMYVPHDISEEVTIQNGYSNNTCTKKIYKSIPLKYWNYEDAEEIANYVDKVREAHTQLKATIKTIIDAVHAVKTSKKFKDTFPELINMIPESVIAKERAKEKEKTPVKTIIKNNDVEVDLTQITKDIAFANIIGDRDAA